MKDLRTSVLVDLDTNEIWSPRLTKCRIDRLILIRKEREGDFIFLLEVLHIRRSIPNANADYFYFSFEIFSLLDGLVKFVHPERFLSASRSVPAENLNDNNRGINFRDSEFAAAG